MRPWPHDVERVAAFLRAAGAEARIEEFGAETATAADAARAAGCDVSEIVKSLIVLCDERPVLVLVPGDRRGDTTKIAVGRGRRQSACSPRARGSRADGVRAGRRCAVSAAACRASVLIERVLLAQDELWVGAGSTRHMAVLPARELVRLTKAAPADLVVAD